MIYLIDDNRRDQQKEYNCDFLGRKEFEPFLRVIDKITAGTDVSYLKDAKCILIHSSFPDFDTNGQAIEAQTNVYEAILALSVKNRIPIVVFTNSILDLDYSQGLSDLVIRVNKRLFYGHLENFLNYYLEHGAVERKILIYGKNFIAQDLAVISAHISSLISTYGLKEKLKEITALTADFAGIAGSTSEVQRQLDMAAKDMAPPASFLNYLEKIIRSVLQHGRNIYS